MFFKVNKKEFLESINIVSKAVSVNSPLPVLHNIKIDAQKGQLLLTASDTDISIQTSLFVGDESGLEIADEGSILLDSKYLSDMIRKIDAEMVEVEILDGCLTNIRGTAVNFELNGIKADNYPLIDFSKPTESFTIKSETLKNIITQTCFATSERNVRPVLMGLNLNCSGNVLTCVATDSFRLSERKVTLDNEHHFNITVPSKNLQDIGKMINTDCDVEISLNDKKIIFEMSNTIVQTRLIDGVFPDATRLIPTDFKYELEISSRELLNALDRASFIKNEGYCKICMELNENEVFISSKSDGAVSKERVGHKGFIGEPLTVYFRANFVFDAIRALSSMNIKIYFASNTKPFIIKTPEDDDILQLISPIRM